MGMYFRRDESSKIVVLQSNINNGSRKVHLLIPTKYRMERAMTEKYKPLRCSFVPFCKFMTLSRILTIW